MSAPVATFNFNWTRLVKDTHDHGDQIQMGKGQNVEKIIKLLRFFSFKLPVSKNELIIQRHRCK